MSSLPAATQTYLTGNTFFPTAIAPAFMSALHDAFYIASALTAVAALTSWFGMRRPKALQEAIAKPVEEAEPQVAPLVKSAGASAVGDEAGQKG